MLRKGNSGKAGLGFKCAIVRPLTAYDIIRLYFEKNTIYPLMCWFVNYSWELYLASIKLLDVNEIVIIIIIFGRATASQFL
jgi:hypothetical protein